MVMASYFDVTKSYYRVAVSVVFQSKGKSKKGGLDVLAVGKVG